MSNDKSNWSVSYEFEYPKITLTDCNGKVQIFDINDIANKIRGESALKALDIISNILEIKGKVEA